MCRHTVPPGFSPVYFYRGARINTIGFLPGSRSTANPSISPLAHPFHVMTPALAAHSARFCCVKCQDLHSPFPAQRSSNWPGTVSKVRLSFPNPIVVTLVAQLAQRAPPHSHIWTVPCFLPGGLLRWTCPRGEDQG